MTDPPAPAPIWRAESYFQTRATAGEGTDPFLGVRRSRLNVIGESPTDRFFVQFFFKDGMRQANDGHLWLQDVSWRHRTRAGTLTLGQFRPPFSRQRLTGDRELTILDRAVAVDAVMPGGGMQSSFARDVGVQWEPSLRGGWSLAAGIFRGSGTVQQAGIGSGGPLLAARALRRFGAAARGVEVGVQGALRDSDRRDFSRVFPGLSAFHGRDTRLAWEASARSGPWRGTAEWLTARFDGSGGSPDRRARGGYVEAARTLTPGFELVAQVQTFDPDTAVVDRTDTHAWTIGANWTPRGSRNRWQFDVVVRRERRSERPNNLLQLQYQHFLTPAR